MRFGGAGRVGPLVTLVTVAALAAMPSVASAATVPDASCTVHLGFSVTPSPGDIKVAQTFTAQHTGALATAQVTVTNSAGSTPGDWRLEIAATDGSGLPATVLAATTVANALADGQQGAIIGSFANPAHVSAGMLYALLVSRPGSSKYGLAGEGGDPCPGQAYFQNAVGGPFLLYLLRRLRLRDDGRSGGSGNRRQEVQEEAPQAPARQVPQEEAPSLTGRAVDDRVESVDDLLSEARSSLARLSPSEAMEATRRGAVLVDIRSDSQRSSDGVIPVAVFIARNVLEWRLDPSSEHRDPVLARRDHQVVVICNEGYQSSLAAVTLRRLGLDATDVIGGFQAWREAELPVAVLEGTKRA